MRRKPKLEDAVRGGLHLTLLLVFVVLKLCGQIDWSWWWVTAPLSVYAADALVVGILLGLIPPDYLKEEDCR